MSKPTIADKDFYDHITKMLKKDKRDIDAIVAAIDVDTLYDLIDAVSNDDKPRTKAIVSAVKLKEGFMIGEPVMVGDEEGTIKITTAPHDTVGVMIHGVLHMIDRRKVKRLDENAILSAFPDLMRIQQLAGIPYENTIANAEEIEPEVECETISDNSNVLAEINAAIDTIANHFETISLADAKVVRKRLNDILSKFNENVRSKKGLSDYIREAEDEMINMKSRPDAVKALKDMGYEKPDDTFKEIQKKPNGVKNGPNGSISMNVKALNDVGSDDEINKMTKLKPNSSTSGTSGTSGSI